LADAIAHPTFHGSPVTGSIVGIGSAWPRRTAQRDLWDGFFAAHFAGQPRAEAVWRNAGVVRRGGVIDPRTEDVSGWGTEARMQRFAAEALPLAADAVERALNSARIEPSAVDQLTVVSCTGYSTPGLDVRLAEHLGLAPSTQRLHIGHMGCYAAVPALATAADAATARSRTSLTVCVELPSLHLQPSTPNLQQVVAHALFGDAAAAVVVAPGAPGLEVVDIVARTDVAHAAEMTWDVTDHGFRMGLSPRVPAVLARHVREAVECLLASHGLVPGDVRGWAVHPGGPRILDVVADRLGLDEDQLRVSRDVLREHGNCSSPTVLLILQRLLCCTGLERGDPVVVLAFGPGLTLYGALLRQGATGR
jgi:predicted naringenin-chalcone synthase